MQKNLPVYRLGRWLAGVLLVLLTTVSAQAQLTGNKTIPGDYASLAAAITDLNTQGVGAGGVTFNIAAGYTETLASPTAGAITATGTSANPIVFQKAGTGANPTITAGVGTSTTVDAIISLVGSDYVTLNGLSVAENAANTTATTQMEFGIALFRPSATDGSQFNTIRNCVVTLVKTNAGTIGIAGAAGTATSGTAVAATATTGANSGNKVYGNVVTNALTGINFAASSSTTSANFDLNNEIGSTTAGTGNTIGNFGGSASGWGAGGNYQSGLRIVGNTINSTLNYTSATASTAVAASTVTSTLRGIYGNTGASANIDIIGNTITLASGATTSAMLGIENGIGGTGTSNVVNITGNTVTGCTYATATSGTFTGITNTATAGTVNLGTNSVLNNNLPGTGTLIGITGGSPTTLNLTGNTITGNTKSGTTASGTMYGLQAGTAVVTATNNIISNNSITATGTATATLYGYYDVASATAETLTGNTITNLAINGASTATGHVLNGMRFTTISSDVLTLTQNTLTGLTIGGSGSGAVTGIYNSSAGGTGSLISRNKIADLNADNASGVVNGIYQGSGTLTITNNLIGNLTAPASTSLTAVSGINVASGTTTAAYFNTIYLNASSTGATFGTSGIYLNSTTATVVLDARNNIVVNTSTAAGTGGYTAALRRLSGTAGTVPANYATTSNNNLFYAGTPSATNLIYVEGTTTATNAQQTLTGYKAFVNNRDQLSITENPPFLSTTSSAATFLHINPATPTQVESAGAPIGSVTVDFDGDTRNATTPDLGADEGTFTPLDLSGPIITLAALGNTSSTANRTLTVTITDPSGVSTTTAPRLFYRKGTSGTFVSALATSVSGSSYTFTFDYSLVGGVAVSDVIQYYVVAQDVPGNVSSNPSNGTFTTTPASVYQYAVLNSLSGVYYVGTSTSPDPTRTYATLTAAAAAYNGNGLGGAVTFLLLDPTYSTAETFPIVFGNNSEASATNTLTIRPNAGVTANITAAGSALAFLNARYLTLDGANTAGGTTRNLTVTNTATTASSYVIGLLSTATTGPGNQFVTVRNTSLVGGSNTNATFGLFVGNGPDNDNITLTNNSVQGVYYGIYAVGSATTSAGGMDNLVVSNNAVGPATASATANIGTWGVLVSNAVAATITGNEVQNVTSANASNIYGIYLVDTKGAVVSRNSVHNISYTGTGTLKVWAINSQQTNLATAANPSTVRLDNNLVYNINATSTSSTWNTVGINLGGGYGDQIVFNTVYLSGQLSAASGTAGSAAFANGNGSVTNTSTNIDVRNNIFSIVGGTGGTATTPLYAHYEQGTTVAGSTFNYNDLYVAPGATGLAVIGRLNGIDYATLAAWQTITSQEANSQSVNPGFVQTATVPYNLTPTAAALNGAGVAIAGLTTDYAGVTRTSPPDIGAIEFAPPACQGVSNLAFTSVTSTTASITFTAPTSGSAANSYTVTYTPAGGTATTITPNPTASPIALTGLTPNTVYTVTVTTNCTGTTSPSVTGTFTTPCTPPVYATLPVTEGFENTWLSRCSTREVPSANWLNTPITGNPSWRRDDDGAAANWTSPTSGAYTPTGSQGSSRSARFHSYNASAGAIGTLDLYADLSAAGSKRLTFDYVNVSTDGSKLDVLLSTDGGATFATTPLLTITTASTFAAQTVNLTATSATAVIRFRATSDFGSYDIGVDNVQLRVLPNVDLAATGLTAPTTTQGCYSSAETVTVTVSNQGAAALDFTANPATVTAVVTTPGGAQTLTGTITTGTLAVGATQNVTLTPTLDMTAVGTYSFAITATAAGDGNTANDLLAPTPTRTVSAPVAGTLTPAVGSICVSGTATLTLAGAANGSIQYQSSADNVTFTDIAGATSATYTTPVLTTTTYYRAQVRCGTNTATSSVSTITVNNPLVASTNTPVNICAGSTATLTATASAGSAVRFFSAATGGTALTSTMAGSYTTPALTASTTYYAEAYTSSSAVAGLTSNSTTNGTFVQSGLTDYPLGFATTQAGTLASVDVYPTAAGTLTLRLYSVSGTQPAGTVTAVAGSDVTITVTAAQVGTRVTIPLNYTLAAGEYKLSNPTGTLGRFNSYSGTYPLTSVNGALIVRGSYSSYTSTSYSNTTYNSFFNLTLNSECVGATRTPIQVNVTQPATASFPAATASTCGTSPYQLAGTVAGSATTGTYTTSGTGTFSPNATTLNATYTPSAADVTAGSVTITLTATAAPCAAATTTLTLSIGRPAVATFSYPTTTTYCAGSAGTVTPTLATGATAGTFSSTAGLTINATTGVITLSTSTAGTYTVTNTVAASGACAAATATTTVTVTPATSAAFSYAAASFCQTGANPTPTVTGTTGGTFSSTAGLSINATTGVITLSASTAGTYTVTYTVAGVCGSSATATVAITTGQLATFSYPATGGNCAGSTGTVTPTLATGATAGTFSSTAGLTLNATTGALNLATSTAGTYTVTNTVAASGSCAAATATATITVNPTPARPTITPIYNGTVTTLTSSAATGNQFYFNGNPITGATGQTYVVNGSATTYGSYTVVVTNSFGCSSLPSVAQVVTTTKGSIAGASLLVYPNPTPDGQVKLELSGFRSTTQLTVIDALGRVVQAETLPATTGVVTHALDLSRMASGVYMLRLTNAEGVETRRLTRE